MKKLLSMVTIACCSIDNIIFELFHSDDDQQLVPTNDMNTSSTDESMPLDDCFNCHVELSRCEIRDMEESLVDNTSEADKEPEPDMFSEASHTADKDEDSTGSWQEDFNLFSAAYPSSQEEEE